MSTETYDMIVIGGGSAGYAAARTAREEWDRVAILDDSLELGGLCILRGCMPSKTLIYSAEVLHLARHGRLFGLDIPAPAADMAELHQRKRRIIDEFQDYRRGQLESDRFTLIRERAAFVDPQTVVLEPSGRRLSAEACVIATGSVVNRPDIDGLDLEGIWTSNDILDLDFLPPSLIMRGGGTVACELAQFLQRMGTKVTLIQRSERVLKDQTKEAAEVVMQVFHEEGMTVCTGTKLERIERTKDGFRVHYEHRGRSESVEAPHVCNALGRRPNTDGLGLDKAEVKLDGNGMIAVDCYQQSSNPRVYAAGDVAGPHEIVHIALLQGEVAARHARGEKPEPVNYTTRRRVVFTDPQVATAGMTPDEARELGHNVIEAEYPFDDHGKSILMEARHGHVKVWADRKTGRLYGAECVGKDGGELIHAMAVALALGADVKSLLKTHWYHPTLSEIWSYPLEELAEKTGT